MKDEMKIDLHKIPVRDLVNGYENNNEEGVFGYGGKLNIRPPYQREFIYPDNQRNAVIDTLRKGFPLNVMYWALNENGTWELLDGQQRTVSICSYVNGDFSLDDQYFHNLTDEEQKQILDYELMVHFTKGNNKEKLDWFEIINIPGATLTDQELRNAIHTGPWLTDAKRYFSKSGCPAHGIANDYLKGRSIRQHYLETAIKWASDNNIDDYMATHQHDATAITLWNYFSSVINWTEALFPNYRKEMKGVAFGLLFNEHKDKNFDPKLLEEKVVKLMQDEDITKKSGIYDYVISGDERKLNIRKFSDKQKREAYERQGGLCAITGEAFRFEEMQGDHIVPWSKNGKTIVSNLQMASTQSNQAKSNK